MSVLLSVTQELINESERVSSQLVSTNLPTYQPTNLPTNNDEELLLIILFSVHLLYLLRVFEESQPPIAFIDDEQESPAQGL